MKRAILAMLLGLFTLVGIAGCGDEEGPAEEAGEEMDDAAEDAGDEIEEGTD